MKTESVTKIGTNTNIYNFISIKIIEYTSN